MLDCKPDKLAQNAPSQSETWEARQAIPRCTQVDKLSQSSIGGTPQIKGKLHTPGVIKTVMGTVTIATATRTRETTV